MVSSPGADPPPHNALEKKKSIFQVSDLGMFEPLQSYNNNDDGDDDRENVIYLA